MPTNASSEASAQDQRRFLDRYILPGLGGKPVAFDATTIPHFTPVAFLRVLDRCQRFGVHVLVVELFTRAGEAIHMQLSSDGLPYSLLSAVVPFAPYEEVTVWATFGVPDALLSMPAVSQELIDAYRNSEYQVYSDDHVISLRVGERNVELARLLHDRSPAKAYLLTTCSPFSRGGRDGDDAETATLRLDLERAGASVLPTVAACGTAWEEAGFLAISLSETDARRFGDEYGQNATVAVHSTGNVELVLLR